MVSLFSSGRLCCGRVLTSTKYPADADMTTIAFAMKRSQMVVHNINLTQIRQAVRHAGDFLAHFTGCEAL